MCPRGRGFSLCVCRVSTGGARYPHAKPCALTSHPILPYRVGICGGRALSAKQSQEGSEKPSQLSLTPDNITMSYSNTSIYITSAPQKNGYMHHVYTRRAVN